MKCPICKGKTVEQIITDGMVEIVTCKCCDGTGVVEPLTNEEWRKTCSAEEFAEFIVDAMVFYDGNRHAFVTEAIEMAKKKNVNLACDSIYKDVVAWLKQPHG